MWMQKFVGVGEMLFKAGESSEVILVDSFLRVLISPRLFWFNDMLHLGAGAMCVAVCAPELSLAWAIFLIVPEHHL